MVRGGSGHSALLLCFSMHTSQIPIHFQAIDPRDHKKERLLNQDKEVRSHMIVRQMKIQRCSRLEHLGQGYHPISWVGNAVSLCCLCLPHLTVWI